VLTFFCLVIIAVSAIGFFYHRGFHYLRCLQHEQYNEKQFVDWLISNKVFDRKGSLIALIAAAASKYFANVTNGIGLEVCIVATIALAALCFFEADPRQADSIDRQISWRMNKIYWLAMLFYSLFTICLIFSSYAVHIIVRVPWCWLAVILIIQSSPIWIILANRIVVKFDR
jgi:UDP-N-acetylmuramoyl-tripeptide--D-alanyl-D-alanine ligase